ncbi:MAG: hypothetical protein WCR06_08810 [bacterium]
MKLGSSRHLPARQSPVSNLLAQAPLRLAGRPAAATLCLLLALFWPAVDAHAEVFMRMGRGAQALEQLGGIPLHRADVRINGQPGKLAVYGFDIAPATLAPDLRKALPLPELTGAGDTMATHIADGQATTLLLLPGAGPRSSLAILIEQTDAAHRKSQAAPAEWPGGLAYPDATLTFSAENEQTRTTLAIATTLDAPPVAASRMDAVLTSAGWSRMPPLAATSSLTLYARGKQICAFSAMPPENRDGKTRITVLQRLGATP